MVCMYHIIAKLKLIQLLQTLCYLATSCLVALEVILMETVENLMIGKDTHPLFIIHKTFVDGLLNSSKLNVITPILEDGLDAFRLLLTITTYKQPIAIQQIALQSFAQQIKILVEDGLHIRIEQ